MASPTDLMEYITNMHITQYVGLEDFSDKISFLYTVLVLLICAALTSLRQYVLKPIACYMPNPIGGENLLEYVEQYCWVQGTVPARYAGNLPETEEDWVTFNHEKILYYQWVPFMLGIQCILFYIPRVVWQLVCYNRTGTDLQHLVTSANLAVHSDTEGRQKMVLHLAKSLEQMLFQHRVFREGKRVRLRQKAFNMCGFCIVSKRLGTWLMFSYIILKFLYLFNAVGQIFIMQRFLGVGPAFSGNYTLFGVEILKNIIQGHDWESTLIFPRVGFCYAQVKHFGATNAVVAQCVLPGNMLNEKIYVFLWFWITIVAIVTAISIPIWFVRMAHQKSRKQFIKKFLKLGEELTSKDKKLIDNFTSLFLRHDGVFLLRMISLNAGDVITSDIVCQLWKIFKTKYKNKKVFQSPVEDGLESQTLRLELEGVSQALGKIPTAPIPAEDKHTLLKRQFSSTTAY